MITIGLVGGVASGKSAVAYEFQKLGAFVLNGDRIGHEVLNTPEVCAELVGKWGDQIVAENGLNRSVLAQLVFEHTDRADNLKFLESVTHPRIRSVLEERLGKLEELNRYSVCVVDAAVMMKTGWDELCDRIVFVEVPEDLRRKRAVLRGMSEEQFLAREAQQIPVEEKKRRADDVIDNSGPPQATLEQVKTLMNSLFPKETKHLSPKPEA